MLAKINLHYWKTNLTVSNTTNINLTRDM